MKQLSDRASRPNLGGRKSKILGIGQLYEAARRCNDDGEEEDDDDDGSARAQEIATPIAGYARRWKAAKMEREKQAAALAAAKVEAAKQAEMRQEDEMIALRVKTAWNRSTSSPANHRKREGGSNANAKVHHKPKPETKPKRTALRRRIFTVDQTSPASPPCYPTQRQAPNEAHLRKLVNRGNENVGRTP